MTREELDHYNLLLATWAERVHLLRTLANAPGVDAKRAAEWLACAEEIDRCRRELVGGS